MQANPLESKRLRSAARAQRPDFDDLALLPARRISASPARPAELNKLISLAGRLMPLSAAAPAIERVYRHDPRSIWAVHGRDGIVGVFAMLFLSKTGLNRLLAGDFESSKPAVDWLAHASEKVAAVYLWAIATPGFVIDAFRVVSLWLRSPRYASADLYARATTPSGARLSINLGFELLPELGLYRFQRHQNRAGANIAVA